jgi:hypothetical protein
MVPGDWWTDERGPGQLSDGRSIRQVVGWLGDTDPALPLRP